MYVSSVPTMLQCSILYCTVLLQYSSIDVAFVWFQENKRYDDFHGDNERATFLSGGNNHVDESMYVCMWSMWTGMKSNQTK